MKPRTLLLILIMLFGSFVSRATITSAQTDGMWSNAGTWDNGVPGCFDTIVIPASLTVEVDGNFNLTACPPTAIIIYGILYFDQGSQLQLSCGSYIYIAPGGSIQANNYSNNGKKIKICNTTVWQGKDGPISGPAGLGPAPLPIELLFFTAEINETTRKVELKWATASEANNDYFTVERSTNGIDWIEILQVEGAGNSSQRIDYTEFDTQPLNFGTSYYRLKQTDFNGDFTRSPTVSLNRDEVENLTVYPNPARKSDQIVIYVPDNEKNPVALNIYSMDGKIIYQGTFVVSETHQIIIDIGLEFIPGLYLIKTELHNAKLMVK